MSFEDKLKELEDIVSKMESEQLELEESIDLYKKANELAKNLSDELNNSLKKMSFIVENDEVKELDLDKMDKKDI